MEERMGPFGEKSARIFDGIVIMGLGLARGNVTAQLPHIIKEFPAVKNCYPGTMNVRLRQSFRLARHDHTTQSIEWMPGVVESFNLTEIWFQCPVDGSGYPGWIYAPQYSPHRFKENFAEILAPLVMAAAIGMPCRLHVQAGNLAE